MVFPWPNAAKTLKRKFYTHPIILLFFITAFLNVTIHLGILIKTNIEAENNKFNENFIAKLMHPPTRTFGRGGVHIFESPNLEQPTTEEDMKARKDFLKEKCELLQLDKKNEVDNFLLTNLYISDTRKAFACAAPKVAITNIRAIFYQLAGYLTANDTLFDLWYSTDNWPSIDFQIQERIKGQSPTDTAAAFRDSLQGIPLSDRGHHLQPLARNYTSWMTARHPFERLVSCYRDKVLRTNFFKQFGALSTFLKLLRESTDVEGSSFTSFPEFIEYVLWCHKARTCLDRHFIPVTSLCSPCHLDYDYIAKFETLPRDGPFVLSDSGLDKYARYPAPKQGYNTGAPTADLTAEYFKELSQDQIAKLYAIYKYDFILFGYV